MTDKTVLSTQEIYKVAYLYHIMGVDQLALSIAFSVNAGRISEACIAMEYAAKHVKEMYFKGREEKVETAKQPVLDLQGVKFPTDTTLIMSNQVNSSAPALGNSGSKHG